MSKGQGDEGEEERRRKKKRGGKKELEGRGNGEQISTCALVTDGVRR